MKSALLSLAALGLQASRVHSLDLDVNSPDSIRKAASSVASNLVTLFTPNQTTTSSSSSNQVGLLPPPYYFWEAGAVWDSLIDYWLYTGDASHNANITAALLAQRSDDNNFLPPSQARLEGNDDQGYWGSAALSAAEAGLPEPSTATAANVTWLGLATNVFDNLVARWDNATCNGGLHWQIFTFNNGYDYKNSASNAMLFQLAGRLALLQPDEPRFGQWADTAYAWMQQVGLIDSSYRVYDGTQPSSNCSQINHLQWSAYAGQVILGAAARYNATSSQQWRDTTAGLANYSLPIFADNSSNILVEVACEDQNTCNVDQRAFKGIFARSISRAALLAPFLNDSTTPVLQASAKAAAATCNDDGSDCGNSWTNPPADGDKKTGVGEEFSALAVVQGLLAREGNATVSAGGNATTTEEGGRSGASSTAGAARQSTTPAGAGVRHGPAAVAVLLALGLPALSVL